MFNLLRTTFYPEHDSVLEPYTLLSRFRKGHNFPEAFLLSESGQGYPAWDAIPVLFEYTRLLPLVAVLLYPSNLPLPRVILVTSLNP